VKGKDLEHRKVRIATLPLINAYVKKIGLRDLLRDAIGNDRYASCIELLIKSVLIEPAALYRIPTWSAQFDQTALNAEPVSDDVLARSLERLFRIDRATLQTKLTMATVRKFEVDVSQIHNDSTSIKLYGQYRRQSKKGIALKRGYSKDHRPDLNQLLYNLSVARDGAVPIHFKSHDGNKTDDTLHIDNWLELRRLVETSKFLYVADSKLCTAETMLRIDREHGRFVTVVPRTRSETRTFATECYEATVRWKRLTRRRSTRRKGLYDIYSTTVDSYQMEEGFRLYWYRSSEKRKRDAESRKDRIERAIQKLMALNEKKTRGRRTEASLLKKANDVLAKCRVSAWLSVSVKHREHEKFTKTTRGKPSPEATYTRKVRRIPYLIVKRNEEQIARSKAMDGIFPLTTNTDLTAREALEAYKYQPHIEKDFARTKSDFLVAPVFLKKNERIEALMFVVYVADLVAALVQRDLRRAMKDRGIEALQTLPEGRSSKTPTWEQIQRLFANHCKYEVLRGESVVATFWDELSQQQRQVLDLLNVPRQDFGCLD
jgi:transposase